MAALADLRGKQFHRLTVLHRASQNYKTAAVWVCRCTCGSIVEVVGLALRSGNTKSCGCLRNEKTRQRAVCRNTTHGLSHLPEHEVWEVMKARCSNPSHKSYPDYGGRGITVCPEWAASFESFYNHVGPRPSDNHSIDRVDNNKGYEPGNVRWATAKQQGRNKRTNHHLTLNGETKTLAEWSEITGIKKNSLSARSRYGWSDERILTTPPRLYRKRQETPHEQEGRG